MMPGTEKGCPGTPAGKVIRKAASRAPNGLPGPRVTQETICLLIFPSIGKFLYRIPIALNCETFV